MSVGVYPASLLPQYQTWHASSSLIHKTEHSWSFRLTNGFIHMAGAFEVICDSPGQHIPIFWFRLFNGVKTVKGELQITSPCEMLCQNSSWFHYLSSLPDQITWDCISYCIITSKYNVVYWLCLLDRQFLKNLDHGYKASEHLTKLNIIFRTTRSKLIAFQMVLINSIKRNNVKTTLWIILKST